MYKILFAQGVTLHVSFCLVWISFLWKLAYSPTPQYSKNRLGRDLWSDVFAWQSIRSRKPVYSGPMPEGKQKAMAHQVGKPPCIWTINSRVKDRIARKRALFYGLSFVLWTAWMPLCVYRLFCWWFTFNHFVTFLVFKVSQRQYRLPGWISPLCE